MRRRGLLPERCVGVGGEGTVVCVLVVLDVVMVLKEEREGGGAFAFDICT